MYMLNFDIFLHEILGFLENLFSSTEMSLRGILLSLIMKIGTAVIEVTEPEILVFR